MAQAMTWAEEDLFQRELAGLFFELPLQVIQMQNDFNRQFCGCHIGSIKFWHKGHYLTLRLS